MDKIAVNGKEFAAQRLLGKGKGGYSYLVRGDEKLFVVKQIHHEPCDYYSFGNKLESELRDYDRLQSIGVTMPRLLDVDLENERILKEYVDGKTVFESVLDDTLDDVALRLVRNTAELCKCNGLNIDYFPTNFILNNGVLYYVDYECNEYSEQWNFENWGVKYWSKTKEFLDYVAKQKVNRS